MRTPVVLPLAACTLLACRTATPDLRPKDVTERPPATAPAVPPGVAAIEALTDPARDPCTQFSAFACAGWTAQARAEGRVGRQAWREVEMAAHTRAQLEAWLATPADADARDDATALRRFYAVCVADLATRVPGHPAVASLEEAIAAVDDVASFLRVSGLLVAHRIPGLFTVWQFPIDGAYAPLVRGYVSDRTPEDGPELAVARRGRLLAALSAYQPAKVEARADAVLAFEDRLHELLARAEDGEIIAAASLPSRPATRRLPFAAFLDGWAAPERAAVHVFPDGYVDRLGPLLRDTAATTLRDYLRWTLVDGLVQSLPGRFADDPRWPPASTCTSLLEDLAGLELAGALGRAALGDDARARAEQIAARVRVELDGVLEESTWLDRQVRSLLRRQLAAARLRLGYGDDAPPLPAMGDDHLANALALRRASFLRRVARDPAYDRPWDDDGWMLLHATAWSDRFVPGVNVSLGMFNAPVFDPQRPLALDVAALGSILGHELMHWTDPDDAPGLLADAGLAPELAAPLVEGARCLSTAYDAAGLRVDPEAPRLELRETLADLGGIRAAYRVHRALARAGQAPRGATLDADQLFFVAAAQFFCDPVEDPDDHNTGRRRIDRAALTLPEFAAAFSCAPQPARAAAAACAHW